MSPTAFFSFVVMLLRNVLVFSRIKPLPGVVEREFLSSPVPAAHTGPLRMDLFQHGTQLIPQFHVFLSLFAIKSFLYRNSHFSLSHTHTHAHTLTHSEQLLMHSVGGTGIFIDEFFLQIPANLTLACVALSSVS